MEPLTAEEYARLRALADRNNAWVDTRRGKNGWASYRPEEVPEDCRMTNEERSAIEVYEFLQDPPERYFAYVRGYTGLENGSGELITWMGDKLGTVTFGRQWRDSFGGRRVPIRVYAINGHNYHGTFAVSSRDSVRIRALRSKRA